MRPEEILGVVPVRSGGTGLSGVGDVGDVITSDGVEMRFGSLGLIAFAPLGAGLDDWPRLNALMQAQKYKRSIVFLPGTFLCKTPGIVPSGTSLVMSPGTSIVSSLPFVDGHTSTPFFSDGFTGPSGGAPATTLTANVAQGSSVIAVVNGAALAVGQEIALVHGANILVATYVVVTIVGNNVTLDRPVLKPFLNTDPVFIVAFANDISIDGNGALLSGTGDRGIQIVAGRRCNVSRLRINSSFSTFVASYDVGGVDCHFDKLNVNVLATSTYGISLEANERSSIESSVCSGGSTAALFLNQCDSCDIVESTGINASRGLIIGGNAPTDTYGCHTCKVGGVFEKNGFTGIELGDGSADNELIGVTCDFNGAAGGGQAGIYFNPLLDNATSSARTKMTGVTCRGNLGYGILCDTSLGNLLTGYASSGNGSTGGSSIRTLNGASLRVNGFHINEAALAVNSAAVSCVNADTLVLERGHLEASGAAAHDGVIIFGAAKVRINDVDFVRTVAGAGACVETGAVAAVIECANVRSTGWTSGAIIGAGASLRVGDDVQLPNYAGVKSFGTVVANGATPVAVPFPDIRTDDVVVLVRTVDGGAPGITPKVTNVVPGTGFNVTSVAGDTSTYAWKLV